ncbi:MAG: AAA family ATPase [Hyphomicrobiaceae bacterium]|nr:MAG: AAA family ATPase [Hyphomicrobiaceae bacterium]
MIISEIRADGKEYGPERDKFGRSFKGLISYLLHGEKDTRDNPARVTLAQTVNLYGDIYDAAQELRLTAAYRAELMKRKPTLDEEGRDLDGEHAAYHFVLSWKPEENPPTPEGMADHARQVLQLLGLGEHEAVLIAHGDTDNPHIHVVANRVHPTTGRLWKSYRAQERMNDYAYDWMVKNGLVLWEKGQGNGQRLHRKAWERKRAAKLEAERAAMPLAILEALTHNHATFTAAQLAAAVTASTGTPQEFAELMKRVRQHAEFIELKDADGEKKYTSKSLLELEQRMARNAGLLAGINRHAVADRHKAAALAKYAGAEQEQAREALTHLLDARGLSVVVGYAGSGKSTLLQSAAEAWRASGYNLRGLALAARTAESLETDTGIKSTTVKGFTNSLERGTANLTPRDVVVIDETGLLGSRQLGAILNAIAKAGAKAVLVGDPEQLQAIEAGGPFGYIVNHYEHARMSKIWRQREEWQRAATVQLAEGETPAALDAYAHAGMVHEHGTKAEALALLLDQWQAGRDTGASQIILTATNAEADQINDAARDRLAAAGVLGPDMALMTSEGLRCFARADRVMFQANDLWRFPGRGKPLGVRNGTTGTVLAIEGARVTVQTDQKPPRVVVVDFQEYGHLAHGYAVTVHKAQGVTVDRAHVLASRNMDRHSAYVALSRHRDRVALHWTREDFKDYGALTRSMKRKRLKEMTLDYAATVRATVNDMTRNIAPTDDERAAIAWRNLYHRQDKEAEHVEAFTGLQRVFWYAANLHRFVKAKAATLAKVHAAERVALATTIQKNSPPPKMSSARTGSTAGQPSVAINLVRPVTLSHRPDADRRR